MEPPSGEFIFRDLFYALSSEVYSPSPSSVPSASVSLVRYLKYRYFHSVEGNSRVFARIV